MWSCGFFFLIRALCHLTNTLFTPNHNPLSAITPNHSPLSVMGVHRQRERPKPPPELQRPRACQKDAADNQLIVLLSGVYINKAARPTPWAQPQSRKSLMPAAAHEARCTAHKRRPCHCKGLKPFNTSITQNSHVTAPCPNNISSHLHMTDTLHTTEDSRLCTHWPDCAIRFWAFPNAPRYWRTLSSPRLHTAARAHPHGAWSDNHLHVKLTTHPIIHGGSPYGLASYSTGTVRLVRGKFHCQPRLARQNMLVHA